MTLELTTERLKLRPLMMTDAPVLQKLIFNDAEVVKWLAHDITAPGNGESFTREWCNKLGLDGDNTNWSQGGFGHEETLSLKMLRSEINSI
jgi:hypothetical protein